MNSWEQVSKNNRPGSSLNCIKNLNTQGTHFSAPIISHLIEKVETFLFTESISFAVRAALIKMQYIASITLGNPVN